MYKFFCLIVCTTLLIGCNKPPKQEQETTSLSAAEIKQQASDALLNDISGVWSEGEDLITLYYENNGIHFIVNEETLAARIGDIDADNETVNIILTKQEDNNDGIFTIRRKWTDDHKQFTLTYTNFDGSNGELNFVRSIGNDDRKRIEKLYSRQRHTQYQNFEDPSRPVYEAKHDSDNNSNPDHPNDDDSNHDVQGNNEYANYENNGYADDQSTEDLIEADRYATEQANAAAQAAVEAANAAAQAAKTY